MECPVCKQIMAITRSDQSVDRSKQKSYDRTVHHCEAHDIWIKVEVPHIQQQTASA
jgi:hypothetical protein